MYNFNYTITYLSKNKDDFENDDQYRDDLLGVFDINEYDDDAIYKTINDIYEMFKVRPEFNELVNVSKASWMSEDDKVGLMGLFTYDYFYLFHDVLKMLHDNQSSHESYKTLIDLLNKK